MSQSEEPPVHDPNRAFLNGGGEMGARMRSFDWASHPLGDPGTWPHSLKTAVGICLGSRFPIVLWWGRDLFMLYNDAYRPMLGTTKHPAALGQAGRQCWPEIWHIIGPMLEGTVLQDGEATWSNDQLLVLERHGYPEECYFTFTYSPIRGDTGEVGGVFCAVIETTDRVVGERRLRQLKELAARTLDAADAQDVCVRALTVFDDIRGDVPFAAVYLFDEGSAGRLVARTRSVAGPLPDLLGREPSESIAWPAPTVVVPIAAAGQANSTGLLMAGVNPERPLDADYRDFLGLVAGQIGSAIAEARALEAERARAEALAELDRAKTAFFSNVSHEFRTPLTLMLGPVRDALASPARSLGDEALETVHRNSLRLLKLVNTLLDFARIEAGRANANHEPTDLATYTEELAGAFRSAIEAAGLRFDVECAPLPEPVHVDRSMWEKIVFNLLSNALKFTLAGGIRLSLTSAGELVRLSVSDTGIGITPDQLPRVFERFRRVPAAGARTQEGSGIGLALVQELVRLHGGTIDAASAPGQGTTFTVSMPFGTDHLALEAVPSTRSGASTSLHADAYVSEALSWLPDRLPAMTRSSAYEPAPPGRARVLVADDNADMRRYVSRILAERWEVEAVPDGASALAAARTQKPDLVLSDIMMPGLDGFQLLEALRRDPDTARVPVVLLSARAGEEAVLEGISAGADDYLVKPFTARDLLARVEAQISRAREREAIRERMAQIESIIDHAPLGVYVVDQDFRIAHANPVARPVFGDVPDLIGADFDDIIHRLWRREYADEVSAIFRRTLETGEPYVANERADYRIDRGVTEYYDWRVVRLAMPDGRFGVVCYFVDISAQVEARQAIARSEQRFRAFVTATSDVVYRMSPDWSEMRQLDGRAFVADTTDPTRSWLEKYIHPDDQPRLMAAIRDAIDHRRIFELEHRIIRSDGSLGWTLSRAMPVFDEHGRIAEWFGAARDVTARRQADEALTRVTAYTEQQRRLYETILSTTPDLVYVFALDHRFVYANQALLTMWGKTWDQAIGKNCLELGYEPWHAAMHDREIDEVIATRQPVRGEVPFTGTQGRRIYDYILVPVIGEDGRVEAVAGATRDVTERKQAEDTLRDRERQLAEANRVKDEFLATLSHELRTPLNAVLGWARILREETLRPEVRSRALEAVERNARAQSQLVDDLLDVSRIMSGKLPVKTESVDLTSVVAAALDAVRPAASARRIALGVEIDPDSEIVVSGDADRLQQVVWNLLSNAVKFTPPGGRIDVELGTRDTSAHVTVRDTGEGIDPAFQPFVFERFRQADNAPSRSHGGLGLGLAIVRHLTEAHGGTVSVSSDGPGAGSTFVVRLPVSEVCRRVDAGRASPAPATTSFAGARVLVVDDAPDARELTRAILESRGAEVVTADSSSEALAALRREPFDALVADIGMPGQDGYSLIQAIRGLPEADGGRTPAIAVTAYASLREREQALSAGYDWHLGKPVDPAQLVVTLAMAIGLTSNADNAVAEPGPGHAPGGFVGGTEADVRADTRKHTRSREAYGARGRTH